MESYFLLENYITSEGDVSHNVINYQPLPITCYQERFYANNYFEELPIVSTAFKENGQESVDSCAECTSRRRVYILVTNTLYRVCKGITEKV